MPQKRRNHLLDIIDSEAYNIFISIRMGNNTYTELQKATTLAYSSFVLRINQLKEWDLVRKSDRGYKLSPTGERVLDLLESLMEVYRFGWGDDKDRLMMEGRERSLTLEDDESDQSD